MCDALSAQKSREALGVKMDLVFKSHVTLRMQKSQELRRDLRSPHMAEMHLQPRKRCRFVCPY